MASDSPGGSFVVNNATALPQIDFKATAVVADKQGSQSGRANDGRKRQNISSKQDGTSFTVSVPLRTWDDQEAGSDRPPSTKKRERNAADWRNGLCWENQVARHAFGFVRGREKNKHSLTWQASDIPSKLRDREKTILAAIEQTAEPGAPGSVGSCGVPD